MKRSLKLNIDDFYIDIIVKVEKTSCGYDIYKRIAYSDSPNTCKIDHRSSGCLWSDPIEEVTKTILKEAIKEVSYRLYNDCLYIHNHIL